MKKNILFIATLFYSSLIFAQDSVKINKSHFNFQTGFANYHFNFNGVYMSGGYTYSINKNLLLASEVSLSNGKDNRNTKFYRPQYECRSLTIGPRFQVAFLKRNTIRAGIGISVSTIDVSFIIGESYTPNMMYQPLVSYAKILTLNTEYVLSYLFRFSNRLQAGINFSQFALGAFHKYNNAFTGNLNLYGANLEFSF